MMTRTFIVFLSAAAMAVLLSGCGADTAEQLKKTQADLAAAEKRAADLKNELLKAQATIDTVSQERDEARHDVQFFARKVNPLEKSNYEKDLAINQLKAELEECRKTNEELKAAMVKPAAEGSAAPPASGQ
jgi:septal ring factor EnvC (AmiA/AmiB activator)